MAHTGFYGARASTTVQPHKHERRLYDPIVGRMLSPDNNVADATNTQAYNRYSYVMNNPLSYTGTRADGC